MKTPFDILGVASSASAEEVTKAYRQLCMIHHPDRGGNQVEFIEVRNAYKKAIRIATIGDKCTACGGTGKKIVTRGASSLKVNCPVCNPIGGKR